MSKKNLTTKTTKTTEPTEPTVTVKKKISVKDVEATAATLLSNPPDYLKIGYRPNAQDVIKFRAANNLDLNNEIFFHPMNETGPTCTFIYYLYLKYKESGVGERSIAPKINLDILKMLDKNAPANPFKTSTNPVGRVGRTLSEIRKLARLNGQLKASEEVRKIIPEKYLSVVE